MYVCPGPAGHGRTTLGLLVLALTGAIVAIAASGSRPAPAVATGCNPARAHGAGSSIETLVISGGPRYYVLHVPPSYDGVDAVPLILNFHGLTPFTGLAANALAQETYSGLSAKADDPGGGFIVVYPEGTQSELAGGSTGWNSPQIPAPFPDDVAFTAGLLDTLESSLCIDAGRVFSTGISNGAEMSVRLACSLSSRIAAIAPVAGLYYPPVSLAPFPNPNESCPDTRPVPIMAIHGTSDTRIPFDGGLGEGGSTFRLPIDNTTPAEDALSDWATHNACTSGRQETPVTGQVRLVRYDGCAAGATVELYIVDGGGHTWPEADTLDVPVEILGKETHDISAGDLMWEFFQAHSVAAPKPTPTPRPVGGIALDPGAGALALAAPESPAGAWPLVEILAGVTAGLLGLGVIASTMGVIALSGGVWYARRRRLR